MNDFGFGDDESINFPKNGKDDKSILPGNGMDTQIMTMAGQIILKSRNRFHIDRVSERTVKVKPEGKSKEVGDENEAAEEEKEEEAMPPPDPQS